MQSIQSSSSSMLQEGQQPRRAGPAPAGQVSPPARLVTSLAGGNGCAICSAPDPIAAGCVPPRNLPGLRGPMAEPAAGKRSGLLAVALGSPLPPHPFPALRTGSPTVILHRERGRAREQWPRHGDQHGQGRCWVGDGGGRTGSCVSHLRSKVVTVLQHRH